MTEGTARRFAAAVASMIALTWVAAISPPAASLPGRPLNVLLVITDDQAAYTFPSHPALMPWLQAQLGDPGSGWIAYDNAVVSTPMCCPSRATILTGRTAIATGVVDNHAGWRLDESNTISTRLHGAGYVTALVGKYLNEYPWDRGPYVPPGWDRWFAKTNESAETTYYGYPVVDDGRWRQFGSGAGDYVTDVLGREALAFIRTAPTDRPWFLAFTPPAPHAPGTPAPRHAGALARGSPLPSEARPATGPAWMRALPRLGPSARERLADARRQTKGSLLAVDEWLHAMVDAVVARGGWDRTVVFFLSDNGFHFGERGWVGKRVPYEPSIRVPFAVRWPPGLLGPLPSALVSNLDITPTIAALAGLPPAPADGISLLDGVPPGRTVPIWWVGDEGVPGWTGVRAAGEVLIEWSTGERELFDLTSDPNQEHDLIDDPAWAAALARLEAGLPEPDGAAG